MVKPQVVGTIQHIEWLILIYRVQPSFIAGVTPNHITYIYTRVTPAINEGCTCTSAHVPQTVPCNDIRASAGAAENCPSPGYCQQCTVKQY